MRKASSATSCLANIAFANLRAANLADDDVMLPSGNSEAQELLGASRTCAVVPCRALLCNAGELCTADSCRSTLSGLSVGPGTSVKACAVLLPTFFFVGCRSAMGANGWVAG